MSADEGYVGVLKAAEIAGVSRTTIWRWFGRGLSYSRPGGTGRPKIRRAALREFIEQH